MASRPVRITLGGQERRLRLTLWSVGEVGDRLGIKVHLNTIKDDLLAVPVSLSALSVLLWAALVHEDETLTPAQVGKWVDLDNAAEVADAFFELCGVRLTETAKQAIAATVGAPTAEALTT